MPNLVIVAIPSKDDYIHKISSQKVPHMTLLFLGEVSKVKNFKQILDFVKHASEQSLWRFGLEVDRREDLGEDKADVLIFSKSKWSGYETVRDYRSYLLKETNIRTAYDSTEQFDEWVPHITLGYPDAPAKPDERDYPGITYVNFDRIAVWFSEFEGIEFPLKAQEWNWEVAMSNTAIRAIENVLTHTGVKGMKWGVRRKATVGPTEVIISDKRKKLKTTGGKGHPAHSDAVRARTSGRIAKKSGLKALSNKELQDYNNRLNLEMNAKRLAHQDSSVAKRFILTLIGKKAPGAIETGGKAALNSSFARKRMAKGAAALAFAIP